MPRKQFRDVTDGDSITFDVVNDDGYRLCPFFVSEEDAQRNFDSIPDKKCRDDDILLVSYPRAGANWVWEIVTLVLAGQSDVTSGYKGQGMVEMRPEADQEALPSPRILNTHLNFRFIPKEAREKKIKTILLVRNPKDLVVSFYHMAIGISLYQYDGKLENYLHMFIRGDVDYGSYAKFLLDWQQTIKDNPDWPIHVIFYEDLKENSFEEIKRLCTYLGRDVSDELARNIADSCQFDNMKKVKTETRPRPAAIYKRDYHNLRKGQVGDWRNFFTVAQNEQFDRWWEESTRDLDMFKFKYA